MPGAAGARAILAEQSLGYTAAANKPSFATAGGDFQVLPHRDVLE
jgi:hypothetical protein